MCRQPLANRLPASIKIIETGIVGGHGETQVGNLDGLFPRQISLWCVKILAEFAILFWILCGRP
jgi:hypothetical protein